MENIGKRLVNSREGKVEFDKPAMPLATLMHYGEWGRRRGMEGGGKAGNCAAPPALMLACFE